MDNYEYVPETIYNTHTPKMEGLYLEPNYKNAKKVAESDKPIYLGILNDVGQLTKARDFLGEIINAKTEKERNEKYRKAWIDATIKEFEALYKEDKADFVILDNTTIVCVASSNYRNKKIRIGKTVCSPEDTFDRKTGIAIAYARAVNLLIPSYV